ncbi:MAG: hypothetical protein IPM56_14905 [Ignavibacteriales bacterium]|nr:MAG: hypothetical protein IPM56_14905 [Ignavibacteriales bacterium]
MLKYVNIDELALKNNYTVLSELYSFEELPDTNPFVISDLHGQISFANKTFWKTFNLQNGNNLSQLSFEPDLVTSLSIFAKSNLSNIKYDHLFTSESGFKYFSVDVERIFLNDTQYFILNFKKNDRNKNLEERVTSLSKALEFSKVAMIIADNTGKITYATRSFELLLNRDIETIFSNTIPSVLYSHLSDREFGKLLSAVNQKKEWKYRTSFLLESVEMKEVELDLHILKDDTDNNITYILTAEDVKTKGTLPDSSEKFLQKENINEPDETVQKQIKIVLDKENCLDQLRDSLLNNLSHEIRTPYTAIAGYSEIIEDYLSEGNFDSVKEIVFSVKEVLKRVLNVFSNVVELAQIESSEFKLDLVKLNCNQVLRSVYNKLKDSPDRNNIEFTLKEDEQELLIETDWIKLEKVIAVLIENSIKFTEQGKIEIRSFRKENNVCISVSDTGIGIAENKLEDLLQPFAQEENGYTRNRQGAGLGLTVAYKLTKLMNGNFSITSEKNSGTQVTLSFPSVSSF